MIGGGLVRPGSVGASACTHAGAEGWAPDPSEVHGGGTWGEDLGGIANSCRV
jgi:hypothetical protein